MRGDEEGDDDPSFPVHVDSYEAVHVDATSAHMTDRLGFVAELARAVERWRGLGRCGAWVRVPADRLDVLPMLLEIGFEVHHGKREYVMAAIWLRAAGPSKLPAYAHTTCGVGAFVVNDRREILAVQEKHGPLRGLGVWKVPGGLVDDGEQLPAAAVRECLEETGVHADFAAILGFRQMVHGGHGQSDLFFLCLLRPRSTAVRPQEDEIADVRWMPLDEFVAQPFYQGLYRELIELGVHAVDHGYAGFGAHILPVVLRPGNGLLAHGWRREPAQL